VLVRKRYVRGVVIMVKVLTLGIVGTVLGILPGIMYFIIAVVSTPQQLATSGFSTSFLYAAGIAALVFSFIGMGGALLGERGLPSFLLSIKYSYLVGEKTIAVLLLIIGAIGIFFTGSIYGIPSAILFVIAAVMIWRRKDETESEQETGEGEQEMDTVTY
jgi:hypothetical protein